MKHRSDATEIAGRRPGSRASLASRARRTSGQGLTEYIAVLVLVAIGAIVAISRYSETLQNRNADAVVDVHIDLDTEAP